MTCGKLSGAGLTTNRDGITSHGGIECTVALCVTRVPRLATVLVALGALTVAACHESSTTPGPTRNVFVTIALDAAAAANGTTKLMDGQTFTGLSGTTLAANAVPSNLGLINQAVTMAFTAVSGANGNFSLSASNVSATGTVKFASCTFTVTTTTNPSALPVGTVITISNCSVTYTANDVPVGSSTGTSGIVTLNLNGVSSNPLDTTVQIRSDGILLVTSGTGETVVTVMLITGSTGG